MAVAAGRTGSTVPSAGPAQDGAVGVLLAHPLREGAALGQNRRAQGRRRTPLPGLACRRHPLSLGGLGSTLAIEL
eukprot:5684700-Lingulodinium_polyedra.AAC.1